MKKQTPPAHLIDIDSIPEAGSPEWYKARAKKRFGVYDPPVAFNPFDYMTIGDGQDAQDAVFKELARRDRADIRAFNAKYRCRRDD